jgi:hypothetical protein
MGTDFSGKGGYFSVNNATWRDVLPLANDHGWKSAGTEPGRWIDPKTGDVDEQLPFDPEEGTAATSLTQLNGLPLRTPPTSRMLSSVLSNRRQATRSSVSALPTSCPSSLCSAGWAPSISPSRTSPGRGYRSSGLGIVNARIRSNALDYCRGEKVTYEPTSKERGSFLPSQLQ